MCGRRGRGMLSSSPSSLAANPRGTQLSQLLTANEPTGGLLQRGMGRRGICCRGRKGICYCPIVAAPKASPAPLTEGAGALFL